MGKTRTFKPTEEQVKAIEAELAVYLTALCHDPQFAIRRACRLLETLRLPYTLKRSVQLEQLEQRLAILRDKQGWGRPWTLSQLTRLYYAKADFRQRPPAPVTRDELERWHPRIPPAAHRPEKRKKA